MPYGLRNTFGFFPNTGVRALNLKDLAVQLDQSGYRPGQFWAPAISITQLVGGPLLAIGLLTRPVAAVVLVFLLVANVERWRVGRYFWNQLGLVYTLMWTIATFYVLSTVAGFTRWIILSAGNDGRRACRSWTPMA